MTAKQQSANEAIERLRETLKPGDTVYTVLRHVSRSGMSRLIDLYKMSDGEPQWLSRLAARAAGFTFDEKKECIRVGGCGMDMGFHLVYSLSRTLFPNGFGEEGKLPLGHEIRPQTQEQARVSVEKGAKFYGRNGDPSGWDTDGGYALRQRWM